MKKIFKNYAVLLLVVSLIIAMDQWTKSIVRQQLEFGEVWAPWDWIVPYARFVHWRNTGVAFGLFQNQNLLFAVLSFIISLIIFIFFNKLTENIWLLKLALCMQLGGSVGNLIDRLTIGYVTDFISVGNFPVFNMADASITIGVTLMVLGIWIQERQESREEKTGEGEKHNPEGA